MGRIGLGQGRIIGHDDGLGSNKVAQDQKLQRRRRFVHEFKFEGQDENEIERSFLQPASSASVLRFSP